MTKLMIGMFLLAGVAQAAPMTCYSEISEWSVTLHSNLKNAIVTGPVVGLYSNYLLCRKPINELTPSGSLPYLVCRNPSGVEAAYTAMFVGAEPGYAGRAILIESTYFTGKHQVANLRCVRNQDND